MVVYRVDENVLTRLKHPFGKLVIGPPERTISTLREVIEREKPTKLIAIGDVVASNIVRSGIKVDLIVIDFKSKRQPVEPPPLNGFEVVNVKNPAGFVTPTACETVKSVLKGSSPTAIVVDGEEDLLTLPVIRFAPPGALVVYGQPHVGMVLVRITDRVKLEAELIMEKMRE